MALVDVDGGSLQADSQPKLVGLVWGLTAAWFLVCMHPNEPSELLQRPCHDDSTIIVSIIIIIITFCVV